MFPTTLSGVQTIWVLDFEFRCPDGERPEPVCMVARNYRNGQELRYWFPDGPQPNPFGPDDLLVAYYASAEIGCFLALGWDVPTRVLDLYVEFKNCMGGKPLPYGYTLNLLGVAACLGIQSSTSTESKDHYRLLAQKESFTPEEKAQLLSYCDEDVALTFSVLEKMETHITNLPQALARGAYTACVASIERTGIPVDTATLNRLNACWSSIKSELIKAVDAEFGVYDGGTFKKERWREYCTTRRIVWPTLDSGALALDEDTFRAMAKVYPEIQPLHELRCSLGKMGLIGLRVGSDGRNRYMISQFSALTGRNQPSTSQSIYGPAKWIRHLIKPKEGTAIAYLDFEQQEFGIAAALSGDRNMQEAYNSGDPYLSFAKLAGAVPPDATKASHPEQRDLYKATILAVQYGMGYRNLAFRINRDEAHAKELLRNHREAFPEYWKWSDRQETRGMVGLPLSTVFGWQTYGSKDCKPLTFRNFPSQANGAEMLRVSILGLVKAGIKVCAPVHDAVLIEAPLEKIDSTVTLARAIMERASRVILPGFTIRTESKIVRYPDSWEEPLGHALWTKVMELLDRTPPAKGVGEIHPHSMLVTPTTVQSY